MATVKIKGLENVKRNVKELFEQTRKDEKLLEQMGIVLVTKTQDFNRAGLKPVDGKKHKPISKSWINRKEELKATNTVDGNYYRTGASNLTFTGQLLKSLKFKIFKNEGKVQLDATGTRKPYKNLDGTPMENTPTNDELAGYMKKQGRPIFGVGRQLNNVIVKLVRSFLNNKIKQSIFKSRKS